VSRSKLRDG